MASYFIGELRLFSFSVVPKNWALCNGQKLPINQNQALFSLLGTMYGGNGQTDFALPDLRGRMPRHRGPSEPNQGSQLGQETHTLVANEMPQHTHALLASSLTGTQAAPGGNLLAGANDVYRG